jgi:transposase
VGTCARKFHDVFATKRLTDRQGVLERVGTLYAVEADIRGRPPDERRAVRSGYVRSISGAG